MILIVNKKIIILHNAVGQNASKDEADVLDQVNSVSKALIDLNYEPVSLSFTMNLEETYRKIKDLNPCLVFNLVESVHHDGRLIYFAPALLDHLKIPYTGSKTVSMFLTSNKILTKQMLCNYGILTSEWAVEKNKNNDKLSNIKGKYIIKALWEEASVGIDENSVISVKTPYIDLILPLSVILTARQFIQIYFSSFLFIRKSMSYIIGDLMKFLISFSIFLLSSGCIICNNCLIEKFMFSICCRK